MFAGDNRYKIDDVMNFQISTGNLVYYKTRQYLMKTKYRSIDSAKRVTNPGKIVLVFKWYTDHLGYWFVGIDSSGKILHLRPSSLELIEEIKMNEKFIVIQIKDEFLLIDRVENLPVGVSFKIISLSADKAEFINLCKKSTNKDNK